MTDFAHLGMTFSTQGSEQTLRTLEQVKDKSKQAETATERMAAANVKASSSFGAIGSAAENASHGLMEFVRGVKEGASGELAAIRAAKDHAATLGKVTEANVTGGHAMRRTASEVANLGRQFSDIGVQIALGVNPLIILAEQGPQIIDVFATATLRGRGFGHVLKEMGAVLRPFLPLLIGIGVTAGTVFGAAGLAARALNKDHKDLIDTLGLTEEQLKRLEDKEVNTSITIRDVFTGVFNYLKDALAQHTTNTQKWLSQLLDDLATFSVRFVKVLIAGFATGLKVIQNTWSALPAVMGDIGARAANAMLSAIEGAINKAAAGINKLINAANGMEKAIGLPTSLHTVDPVKLGRVQSANSGALSALNAQNNADTKQIYATVDKNVGHILKGVGDSILKATGDRLKKDAGDAKEAKAPKGRSARGGGRDPAELRDMTDERIAQVMDQLARAYTDELQAQLQLAKDADTRMELTDQIILAETAAKQAAVDRQIAATADDDHIDVATKKLIVGRLRQVQEINANVAVLQMQNNHEKVAAEKVRDAADLEDVKRDAQVELLKAQQGAARTAIERHQFSLKIQAKEQVAEKAHLQSITQAAGYNLAEVAKAKARLGVLDDIHDAERQRLKQERTLADDFHDVQSSVQDFGDAFKQHDWMRATEALILTIQQVQAALAASGNKASGAIGAIAGLGAGIGGLLGGRAGGALSGAFSGLGSAATLSQALGKGGALSSLGLTGLGSVLGGPIGLIAGGLLGGLGSLLGGNKKSRQQRREEQNQAAQEKNQKAQEIADQRKALELRLVELSGDKVAYLAAQRRQELASIDASNKALQQQVYDAEDAAARQASVRSAEEEYLKLTGGDLALLNRQRADELKAIDATLVPLQKLVYAAQDAATAVDATKQALQTAYDAELQTLQSNVTQAHDDLSAAYNRESGQLGELITKNRDFAKSLRDYRTALDRNADGLSPENAYTQAKTTFTDVSRRARIGDQDAMAQAPDVFEAFRQASQSYNGVGADYFKDLADIKDATDAAADTADRTADVAEQQLDELKTLVDGYLGVKEVTISVRDAVRNLETAQQALDNTKAIVEPLLGINASIMSLAGVISAYQAAVSAQAAAQQALISELQAQQANPANTPPAAQPGSSAGYSSTNGDYAAYVEANADLKSLFQAQTGMARGRTEEEFGQYHWAQFGSNENRGVRPYARGGEFAVGGDGGVDSQHVQFMASPDEHVTVKTPQQMARETAAQERMARALEHVETSLDAVVYELKADKTQRGAGNRVLAKKLDALGDSLETFKRRAPAG